MTYLPNINGGVTTAQACAIAEGYGYISAGGAISLDQLTDASAPSPASGDLLVFTSSEWKSQPIRNIFVGVLNSTAESSTSALITVSGWTLSTLPANSFFAIQIQIHGVFSSIPNVKFQLGTSDTGVNGFICTAGPLALPADMVSINAVRSLTIAGSGNHGLTYFGTLRTGASTTNLWFSFAQTTSSGANPCKILPGSMFTVTK